MARAAHLHADQRVRITVEGERVIITPLRDEPLTLEQRLARFDPERHSGEAMPSDEALGPSGGETPRLLDAGSPGRYLDRLQSAAWAGNARRASLPGAVAKGLQ